MNRWTVCLIAVFGTLSPPSVFAQEGKVTVFAAASMKDALDEINAAFTKEHRHQGGRELCGESDIGAAD